MPFTCIQNLSHQTGNTLTPSVIVEDSSKQLDDENVAITNSVPITWKNGCNLSLLKDIVGSSIMPSIEVDLDDLHNAQLIGLQTLVQTMCH